MNKSEIIKNLILLEDTSRLEAVMLSRTKTSKITDDCATELANIFQKYFDLIVKNKMSIVSARNQFGQELADHTKSCIQKAYFAGMDYVSASTKKPVAISVKDVNYIEDLTIKTVNAFFDKVYAIPIKTEFISLPMLFSWIQGIPQTAVYSALNQATVSAFQDLNDTSQIDNGQLIFITRDDPKVCEICYPLHQKIYQPYDEKPRLPIHPRCRCRLLVYDPLINY